MQTYVHLWCIFMRITSLKEVTNASVTVRVIHSYKQGGKVKEWRKTVVALICEGCCDFPPFFLFMLVHLACVPHPSAIRLCSM